MKNALILSLSLVITGVFSQTKKASFTINVDPTKSSFFVYRNADFDNETNEFSLHGWKWTLATIDYYENDRKKSFSGSNESIPFIYQAKVIDDKVKVVHEAYDIRKIKKFKKFERYDFKTYYPYKKDSLLSDSKELKSLGELRLLYPKVFQVAESTDTLDKINISSFVSNEKITVIRNKTPFIYDENRSSLTPAESKIENAEVLLKGFNDKLIKETDIKDNKRKYIAVTAYERKKGKEFKYLGYKNKHIFVIDSANKLIAQHKITFDYPRSLIFQEGIAVADSDTTTNFKDGIFLVYGRVFGLGKKNNDPDKRNYEIVILDSEGKIFYQGKISYGEENTVMVPVFAYRAKDAYHLFAKSLTKGNSGFVFFKFDSSGLIDETFYNNSEFEALIVGSKENAYLDKIGLNFKPINTIRLENGDFLISGETYNSERKTLQPNTPENPGTLSRTIEINTYFAHTFFHFDAEGNYKNQYSISKTDTEAPKRLVFGRSVPRVESVNDFLGGPKRSLSESVTLLKEVKQKNGKIYFVGEESEENNSYAVLLTIDTQSKSANKIFLADENVYDIRGEVIYKFYDYSDELIFVGEGMDEKSYIINSVVYLLD